MILITIDSHPADGGDANSLDTSDDRLPCGPWSLLGLYFNIHINMMISDQSINMSVIKTLLKVTNNFISLCQSRVLRIPAVSTGQCPTDIVHWKMDNDGELRIFCYRWGIFAASLKLWNGNQKNYQWPPSWWVNNNILSHQQSNFKAKIYNFTKTFHIELNAVVMGAMSVQDQCPDIIKVV